jgi:hypothetical protein
VQAQEAELRVRTPRGGWSARQVLEGLHMASVGDIDRTACGKTEARVDEDNEEFAIPLCFTIRHGLQEEETSPTLFWRNTAYV